MRFSPKKRIAIGVLCAVSAVCLVAGACSSAANYEKPEVGSTLTDLTNKNISGAQYYGSFEAVTESYASEFIMTRHKSLGGSHYAYTEGITDDLAGLNGGEGTEGNFFPGSQLVKLSYSYESGELVKDEVVLIDSPDGVVRDPDVSADGTKVVFSWKTSKTQDDFHLYIYDLKTESYEQITFGQGISDTEPKWLPNGKIVFSSSRCVQIIDCWKTPISNLYTCNDDGSDIIRVGYDQVHTTYPTVAEDGRVIYTRWDYNDRTQMYIHGIFSMNQDGTGQTAVFGNNTNNPTSQLHTVAIPGTSDKYLTIMAGHHVYQGGKLAIIDTSKGREGQDPVTYVFEKAETDESFDTLGQSGPIYKYPVAINEHEFFYAVAEEGWAGKAENTQFKIYYYNDVTGEKTLLADNVGKSASCSQISPIRTRNLFNRPSSVDYSSKTGTYYVADVYEGEAMEGVERGDVKYLRVVTLDYRPYAVGSLSAGKSDVYPDGFGTSDPSSPVGVANSTWDVKQVIGIVPVEEDGSVMFECPADEPVYFQLLDENGFMIQTMRSWSTLMPGEVFSCVGCHEDKNTVPLGEGKVTLAMKKGVQRLQKDLWMTTEEYEDYDPYTDYHGFSYAAEIQPILDASCISCHSGAEGVKVSMDMISSSAGVADIGTAVTKDTWKVKATAKSESVDWTDANFAPADWESHAQPFGSDANSSIKWGASDDAVFYMTQKFTLSEAQLAGDFFIRWRYDEDPQLYLNGERIDKVAEGGNYISSDTVFQLNSTQKALLKAGDNVITARAYNKTGGSYMSVQLTCKLSEGSEQSKALFALTDDIVTASRDKVDYYLSYLVLTGAVSRGSYYVGRPVNEFTDWVGGMSGPEVLPARAHGATQSHLIELLLEKHGGVQLEFDEIARIAAWIDLAVPFRGAYIEASENWGAMEMGEAERRQNMRDFYTKMDELNKAKLAGQLSNKKVLIEYYDKADNFLGASEGKHLTQLYLDQKIQPGDRIIVTLPKGQQYVWFNLNPKIKLSLQYCPDGIFTYVVPDYAELVLPNLTVGSDQYVYTHPTITAFLPTEEDLNAVYNVALNPYDAAYKDPDAKITAGTTWENDGYGNFMPNNAVDGFRNNRGHGSFPVQSWGPDRSASADKFWLNIDFGREVELYSFALYIRADFPHDTYITELTFEFSDGTTYTWKGLKETNQVQTFELPEAVRTTSVKIKDIKSYQPNVDPIWWGITEFEAYGKNVLK